ncbi:uncharacterized protein LOC115385974 isoform X1 [Salarias fasciatus]|uniref:uncharacterized protein LOC115385974 isoform X1 n=1 Tax=Salarias fasciatus TaxID=181472 RepID=UPI0011768413|nr:uncharacterized protein LOC115385974 isoform X1 [Salarias fasciatus]
MKTGNIPSDVFFYKNNKLIENETRGEMKISAVSESDEGFYKCQYNGRESAQSWMAVQFVSRQKGFPMWTIGLICGLLLLIFLLLLLCCCRKTTDSCFNRVNRCQSSQQSQTTDHSSNQLEDQCNTYASPFQGESDNVTYSSIKLKKVKNVKKKKEPEESTVYADVKTTSSQDDEVTYAQVKPNKCNAKGKKGRTAPAAAEETVYSEVKAETTHDN